MPACHEASAVTMLTVADVTFVAVIALAVTDHRPAGRQALVLFTRNVGVTAAREREDRRVFAPGHLGVNAVSRSTSRDRIAWACCPVVRFALNRFRRK